MPAESEWFTGSGNNHFTSMRQMEVVELESSSYMSCRSGYTATSTISSGTATDSLSPISRLCAPKASEHARKWKCTSNPTPLRGKRKSLGSCHATEPKSIRPEQHIRELPDEPFVVSNGN